jgi:hypothetical protein
VKGLEGTSWRCGEVLSLQYRASDNGAAGPIVLASFATGLPPQLIGRLRDAASELGLPESVVAAVAIALFLEGEGF